jgi:hypothetical protein
VQGGSIRKAFMKLRIHGDSLRVRVTKTDLAQLQSESRIHATLEVAPGQTFAYVLAVTDGSAIDVEFADATLSIYLPRTRAAVWYGDAEVSVEGVKVLPGGRTLEVLIEKDFTCLVPRPGEDQSDYFANPAKTTSKSAADA